MNDTPWWHDGEAGAGGGDSLGNAAAEAARLFEAVRDRVLSDPATLRTGLRLMEAFTVRTPGEAAAPGEAPECAYCPVCQAIARARNLDADTVERLTGAAVEFAETVRRTMSSQTDGAAADDRVRHVPLDDEGDGEPLMGEDAGDPVGDVDEAFLGWPVDDVSDQPGDE